MMTLDSPASRILIVAGKYHPDEPSGSSRLAFDEAVYLAGLGHEVWMLVASSLPNRPDYCFQDGLHVLRYEHPRLGAFDPRKFVIPQQRLRALLAKHAGDKMDIVHGHWPVQFKVACDYFQEKARTCYSVHSPVSMELKAGRSNSFKDSLWKAFVPAMAGRVESECLRRADSVNVFSQYTKRCIEQLYGRNVADRVHVVPGWVNPDRFRIIPNRDAVKQELGWPTDVPVIFTLRRLVQRMGLDRLLLAAKHVADSGLNFKLVIAGVGPLRSQLERMVSELRLENMVQLAGFVPDPHVPLMFGSCDAFVLPTTELECFGLIAIEALACGRPVLSTPVGALHDVVSKFEPRWLAEGVKQEQIAALLSDYLLDKLPSHEPEELRAEVERSYSRDRVLPLLAKALFEAPTDLRSEID